MEVEKTNEKPFLNGFYQTYCWVHEKFPERFTNVKVANETTNICDKYFSESKQFDFTKFIIIAINFVLRMIIIQLIISIGHDTLSEQAKVITNAVFVV